jgi:hypothetical protein
MSLPNYITAIRTVTYDVEMIRESLLDFYDDPADIKDEDIIGMIDDWASEDLGVDYRLLDEEGEELDF